MSEASGGGSTDHIVLGSEVMYFSSLSGENTVIVGKVLQIEDPFCAVAVIPAALDGLEDHEVLSADGIQFAVARVLVSNLRVVTRLQLTEAIGFCSGRNLAAPRASTVVMTSRYTEARSGGSLLSDRESGAEPPSGSLGPCARPTTTISAEPADQAISGMPAQLAAMMAMMQDMQIGQRSMAGRLTDLEERGAAGGSVLPRGGGRLASGGERGVHFATPAGATGFPMAPVSNAPAGGAALDQAAALLASSGLWGNPSASPSLAMPSLQRQADGGRGPTLQRDSTQDHGGTQDHASDTCTWAGLETEHY